MWQIGLLLKLTLPTASASVMLLLLLRYTAGFCVVQGWGLTLLLRTAGSAGAWQFMHHFVHAIPCAV